MNSPVKSEFIAPPYVATMQRVDNYADIDEILRSPDFMQGSHRESGVFFNGSLLLIEGERERWAAAPHEETARHALHAFCGERLVTEMAGYHFDAASGARDQSFRLIVKPESAIRGRNAQTILKNLLEETKLEIGELEQA